MSSKRVICLVGTRPEIIKMAPVLRELAAKKVPYVFVHSNQHYAKAMDAVIFRDLRLKKPDYDLLVGSGSHAVQTGRIMERFEQICLRYSRATVVVHGDTNTTLAGALTAKKLRMKVAHIEAGLRSHDYQMPEEVNRTLVDRVSDILFAPTPGAKKNLLHEGITAKKIVVTGNTVIDALKQHLILTKRSHDFKRLGLHPDAYILATLHRTENVDQPTTLKRLLVLLEHAATKLSRPIIWPLHPRTAQQLREFGFTIPSCCRCISPLGYIDMLALLQAAALVMTDSGGIQEEAYVLKRPVVTLRDSTERPETLAANFLIHISAIKFDAAWKAFLTGRVHWGNELGDGPAASKIVETLRKRR